MNNQIVNDERFAKIYTDKRFTNLPKQLKKIKVDNRFMQILKDPKFNKGSSKDIRGGIQQVDEKSDIESQISEQQEQEVDVQDSKSQSEEQIKAELTSDIESSQELPEEKAKLSEETSSRLALQNYDWQILKAKDILKIFNSFLPTMGKIESIQVFKSQFGKQQMEQEQLHGPTQIFKEISSEQAKKNNKKKSNLVVKAAQDEIVMDVDKEKLRQYEKDRLKYYFAVINCDSKQSAQAIYDACDGNEFENTAIRIDLRFIPDDIKFQDQPYDYCDIVAPTYKVINDLNRAEGHTNVQLTWENENTDRTNFWLKNKNTDIDKVDWSEFLADDLLPPQTNQDTLDKASLLSNQIPDWKKDANKKKNRKNDLVITFKSGFNNEGNQILTNEFKKQKNYDGQDQKLFIGFQDDDEQESQQNKQEKPKKMSKKYQEKLEKRDRKAQERRNRLELELLVETDKKEIKVDLKDKRFSGIFNDSNYAIDPTSKYYKEKYSKNTLEQQVAHKKSLKQ